MNSFRLGWTWTAMAVALLVMAAGSAARGAVALPIINAGFEDPVLGEGNRQLTVPGWTQGRYDVSAPTVWIVGPSGAGVWNPDTSGYGHGSAFEGSNMAFTTSAAGYDTGLSQVLLGYSCALQADATYVLSVVVGNPYLYNLGPTADYRIELVAGGVVLASATGPPPADDTTWATARLTYNSGPAPVQLGQQLEIRLLAKDFASAYKVDFDDVRLDATFAHPIADPNGPYSVVIGTGSLSLDGSRSLPSDGSSLSLYEWDLNNDGIFGDVTGLLPAPIDYATLMGNWGMTRGANTVKLRVTDATTLETATQSTIVNLLMRTVTYIGPNTANADKWNLPSSWDTGEVPSGAVDVVIPAGKLACAWSNSTPTYTGNLTIRENATVQITFTTQSGYQNSVNALGTPGSTTIYMYEGSHINNRQSGTIIVPAIELMGNAAITLASSTQAPPTMKFDHGITGPYTLTLSCNAGGTGILSTSNSFSKLIVYALPGRGGSQWTLKAAAPGSLGTGDVIINPNLGDNRSPQLYVDAPNVMADTATLYLYGAGPNADGLGMLYLNASDTIAELYFNGMQQPPGTYGKVGNTNVDYQMRWITGNGVLTVLGMPAFYWDLNGTDPGAGGETPSGTWDAAVAYWNAAADGTGATAAWTPGQTAAFAAGTDATGTYTVTVHGTQQFGGLTFEEGNVTLSGGALQMTRDSMVRVATEQVATIAAEISDDGTPRRLAKGGDGTLVLTGNNTYTGVTRLEAGTLSVASLANAGTASPLGNYPAAGAGGLVLVGGTLQYTGSSTTIDRGFTLSGSSTIELSNPGTALTLGNCASSTLSGTLTVTGGDGSSLALGEVTIVEGAGITLNPTNVTMTVASVKGYSSYPLTSNLTLSGTTTGNAITGNLYVQNPPGSGYTQPLHVFKAGSGEWTIRGVFSGGGNLTVNGGTLTLLGTNTYTGTTTVAGGTLIVGTNAPNNANGAFGKATSDVTLGVAGGNTDATILISGPYTVGRNIRIATANNTDTGTRVLTLGGNTADVAAFSGAIYLGTANQTSKGVTLTAASGGKVTFSGVIQNPTGQDANEAAAAAAINAVTKVGLGTVVLSNANTYTGKTLVNEGTLLVNNTSGSGTGTGPVIVNANGTLGGTGTIAGAVTVAAGGNLAPGTSIGTITLGNGLDMSDPSSPGANMTWELATLTDSSTGTPGVDFDFVKLTGGDLVLGGQSTLTLVFDLLPEYQRPGYATPDPFWTSNHSWKIIDTTSNPDNTNFVNLVNASFSAGRFTTTVGTDADLGHIFLNYIAGAVAPIAGVWIGTSGGIESWATAGNWQGGNIPTARGDTAAFGDSIGSNTLWLLLAADRTLSGLTLSNTLGGSYTIAPMGSEKLKLDNGDNVVPVAVEAGSHTIFAPLSLASNVRVDISQAGATLTVSGPISGAGKSLTKSGPGTLVLEAANTFTGTTEVQDGTLVYNILAGSPTVIDNQQLIITGGTVNASGLVDPFTDGIDTNIHVDVLNNAAFNITSGSKQVDELTGTGTTTISAGAELTASYVRQSSVSLGGASGIPAKLVLRSSHASGALLSPADASTAVPEPGTVALLAMAILSAAVARLRASPRPRLGRSAR